MNAQDFCFWLHGFTELTRGQTPDPAQWKAIKEHLDLVFKKVTPTVAAPSAIPTPTTSPALPLTWPNGWPTWITGSEGITVTC